jgi:hypothetical protein
MPVDTDNLATDHLATPADATKDWYRRLGASQRRRDEVAQLTARASQERDDARQLACHRRWPAIVDAMRTLIACYNDGAREERLIIVDGRADGEEPTVTVRSQGGRTLVMAVDGADLWVRASQDENGRMQGERWIGLNRTDEATANCVLQDWLAKVDVHVHGQHSS